MPTRVGDKPNTSDATQQFSVASHFRTDVQGLRAIAVGLVIAYHLELPIIGGFLGVDVFFVISGFVISRSIIRDFNSSAGFSLQSFFSRRAKRILPIFFVVTLLTLISSQFFLSPFGEIRQVTETATWSALVLANEQLLRSDSYLGLIGNPLRHLWSLAVEEQFYLVFPFIFFIYLKTSQKSVKGEDRARVALGTITALSLLVCVLSANSKSSFLAQFSFFSVFSRAWQFFFGVAVALSLEKFKLAKSRPQQFLVLASAVGILWSVFSFAEDRGYPGLWALLPTISTACLLFSSIPGSFTFRILSFRPLVNLGDISYSMYLWHWPIVVYASRFVELNFLNSSLIVLLTIFLSLITYRFIELPFRAIRVKNSHLVVAVALMSATLMLTSFLIRNYAKTVETRAFAPRVSEDFNLVQFGLGARDTGLNLVEPCSDPSSTLSQLLNQCSNGVVGRRPSVLLLGDSHAAAIGDGLFEAGQELGEGVFSFFEYGCPLIDDYTVQRIEDCRTSIVRSLELVEESNPRVVIIAQSYSAYLTSEQTATSIISPDSTVKFSEKVKSEIQLLIKKFEARLNQIGNSSTTVVILEEVPFAVMPGTRTFEEFKSHTRLLAEVNKQLNQVFSNSNRVKIVNVDNQLCKNDPPCAVDEFGKLQYWHKTHLNRTGSLRLSDFWADLLRSELIAS